MMSKNIPTMAYESAGTGDPLVLLPGGLTGWLSWIPHAETLSGSYRVTRLQLHSVKMGLERVPLPSDYSIGYEVDALEKTLDQLGIQQADMAGWSYGGAVGLSFAIHHPHRVKSLTLIEPPAYWVLRSRGPLSQDVVDEQAFMRSLNTEDVSEDQLIAFMRAVRVVPPDIDPRTMPQWAAWFKHRQSLRMGDTPYRHEDDIALVRQFEKPVLLVKGIDSSPILHRISDILAEEFPNAEMLTVPQGHAPHIVSMPAFLERFTSFIQD